MRRPIQQHGKDVSADLPGFEWTADVFRDLIEAAPDAMVVAHASGRIVLVNTQTERLFGWSRQELLGQKVELLIPERFHERYSEHRTRYLAEPRMRGMGVGLELHGRRKEGSEFPIEISLSPIETPQGVLLSSAIRDITERKRAEAELEKEREFLKAVLENLAEGIVACDAQGVLTVFNPATREMHSLPQESLPAERWADYYDLFLADGQTRMSTEQIPLFRALQGETVRNCEMVIAPKHHPRRTLVCNGQPIITPSGQKLGAVVALHDVTERKRTEEILAAHAAELARSNQELEQFAYVASHDLQEPLRTVASYTQLLARRYHGKLEKDADEFIHYITDAVHRMQGLIEGLLAYSRVTRQGGELTHADLGGVLKTALSNLGGVIEASGASVTHDPLPTLSVDKRQMVQLFQNLLGNAIKFSDKNAPKVHVSARHNDGEWAIFVRDNGIGIDVQHFERIFVLFQRLHTRDQIPGSGIGLALCKKIVEHHRGRIWVESAGPGAGSTFCFTLPNPPGRKQLQQ